MWQLLASLPRQQRAVLVLRFYEGLPDDEIARLFIALPAPCASMPQEGWSRLAGCLQRHQPREFILVLKASPETFLVIRVPSTKAEKWTQERLFRFDAGVTFTGAAPIRTVVW